MTPAAPLEPLFSSVKVQPCAPGMALTIDSLLPAPLRSRPHPVGMFPCEHATGTVWRAPGATSDTGSIFVSTARETPFTPFGRSMRTQRSTTLPPPSPKRRLQVRANGAGRESSAPLAEVGAPLRATARAGHLSFSEPESVDPVTEIGWTSLAPAAAGTAAVTRAAAVAANETSLVVPRRVTVPEPNIGA